MKRNLKCLGKRREKGMGRERRWRGERKRKGMVEGLKTGKLIELKHFLYTDFTAKNYFRDLSPRLGYRFHHLTKIKTHLNTTPIGQISDKQVKISR